MQDEEVEYDDEEVEEVEEALDELRESDPEAYRLLMLLVRTLRSLVEAVGVAEAAVAELTDPTPLVFSAEARESFRLEVRKLSQQYEEAERAAELAWESEAWRQLRPELRPCDMLTPVAKMRGRQKAAWRWDPRYGSR